MSKTHDNTVVIRSSSIRHMEPNGEFVITSGQSYNPPIKVSPEQHVPSPTQTSFPIKVVNEWEITVDCGRKGSEDVALQFDTWSGSSTTHEFGLNVTIDSSPDELNFAFGMVFTFEKGTHFAKATLYFGQGHVASVDMNNWWIGSPHISSLSSNSVLLSVYKEDGSLLESYSIAGQLGFDAAYTFVITPRSNTGKLR